MPTFFIRTPISFHQINRNENKTIARREESGWTTVSDEQSEEKELDDVSPPLVCVEAKMIFFAKSLKLPKRILKVTRGILSYVFCVCFILFVMIDSSRVEMTARKGIQVETWKVVHIYMREIINDNVSKRNFSSYNINDDANHAIKIE